MDVLQPRIVVTLGVEPFLAIRDYYIDAIQDCDVINRGYAFIICRNSGHILVWRAFNPGRGYMNIRGVWNKLASGVVQPDYQEYFPEGITSPDGQMKYLQERYGGRSEAELVNEGNMLYELILDQFTESTWSWLRNEYPAMER